MLFRENLFKGCGEIVDIRLHSDREGRFKGFGHVQFATAEAAQKVRLVTVQVILELPIMSKIIIPLEAIMLYTFRVCLMVKI